MCDTRDHTVCDTRITQCVMVMHRQKSWLYVVVAIATPASSLLVGVETGCTLIMLTMWDCQVAAIEG